MRGSFNYAIWLPSLFTNQTSWLESQLRTVPLDALPPANQDPKKRQRLKTIGTSVRAGTLVMVREESDWDKNGTKLAIRINH